MKRAVLKLYDFFSSHRSVLLLLLVAVIVAFAVFSSRMTPREDITAFLPGQEEYGRINEAYSNIRAANMVMVTVSAAQGEENGSVSEYRLMDAADSLVSALVRLDSEGTAGRRHVRSIVKGEGEEDMMRLALFIVENMPLYLDSADYSRMPAKVNADSVSAAIDRVRASMFSFQGVFTGDILLHDPLMFSGGLLSGMRDLAPESRFTAKDGYLFDGDGSLVFFVESAYPIGETMGNKELIKLIDNALSLSEEQFPDCSFDAFGPAYVSVGNADTIKRDTILSVAVSLTLLLLLLIYAYNSLRPIALIIGTLLFGLSAGLAVVSSVSAEVSLIVLGIGSVLIGIAANYPLHFLDHVADGYSARDSISDIFYPLTIGNVTTVGAFLSLLFLQ